MPSSKALISSQLDALLNEENLRHFDEPAAILALLAIRLQKRQARAHRWETKHRTKSVAR